MRDFKIIIRREGYILSHLFIKGITNKTKICTRHGSGLRTMKKNIINLAIVAFSATTIGFCAAATSTSASSTEVIIASKIHTYSHACAHDEYCIGIVSYDGSGVSPITYGKERQKSYCQKCGHVKSCRK